MYDYVPFLLFRMYLFIKRIACNKYDVGETKMAMLGIVAAAAKHKDIFNGPYSSYSYPKLILARDSRWGQVRCHSADIQRTPRLAECWTKDRDDGATGMVNNLNTLFKTFKTLS